MARPPFDVGAIVPSMRDFLQAIATRRKRLALVPWIEDANDLERLEEIGVSSVACPGPGDGMRTLARSRLPVLCLERATEDDDALAARAYGADAVLLDPSLDASAIDRLAKTGRSTRMAALPTVDDESSAARANDAGFKAAFVVGDSVDAVVSFALKLPSPTRVLAHVRNADVEAIRALAGKVDAALVEYALGASTDFAALSAEVDPG